MVEFEPSKLNQLKETYVSLRKIQEIERKKTERTLLFCLAVCAKNGANRGWWERNERGGKGEDGWLALSIYREGKEEMAEGSDWERPIDRDGITLTMDGRERGEGLFTWRGKCRWYCYFWWDKGAVLFKRWINNQLYLCAYTKVLAIERISVIAIDWPNRLDEVQ